MQGRAFGFLALLGGSWILARIGIAMVAPSSGVDNVVGIAALPPTKNPDFVLPLVDRLQHDPPILANHLVGHGTLPNASRHMTLGADAAFPMLPSPQVPSPVPNAALFGQISAPRAETVARQPALALAYAPAGSAKSAKRPFDVYAYSFWRRGNTQSATLGNGQYGGSQSAIITNVPLMRFEADRSTARLALTGRFAVAHGVPRERELAAGVQWRPSLDVPVNIIAERRFRQDRPDAFAVFVAGGQSSLALPVKFRLDVYGQAGVVSGSSGGAFADMMVQARRPIVVLAPAKISAGAGAWAGGQDNVMRLDIGPSIAADMPIAGAQFRLEASWRFRVAGDADPSNGPAVTLSTSF